MSERLEGRGETAEAYWGAHAAEYNEFIVRVVPRYEEQLQRLLDYAPLRAQRILELGCGSGNASLRLAGQWPDAEFTFVDGAPAMLELTRARLQDRFPAIARSARFVAERFEDLTLEPRTIDVVIASLSLHHVADVSVVYRQVAPALVSGARLVMLDGVRGATVAEHDVHMARWAAFWRQPGNLSDDEIRDVNDHIAQHDHYRSLPEHFDMLRAAGFRHPDCVWRDGLFALLTASRA
ncbi:MAG: class I SAM-dependent methyltransferase [Longimicrobiales bacterium]